MTKIKLKTYAQNSSKQVFEEIQTPRTIDSKDVCKILIKRIQDTNSFLN